MSRASRGVVLGIAAGFAALIGLGAGAGVLQGEEAMIAGAGALLATAIAFTLLVAARR